MREHMTRTASFVRREVVASLRQPWLLASLILGPFLVLFIFGLGYSRDFPTLTTIVVGQDGDPLAQRVDDYVSSAEVTGIDYRGTVTDEGAAIERLRRGEVDLVVSLPDSGQVDGGQRAVIEVHQRSPDPVTLAQIDVAAQTAMHQINDQAVAEVLTQVQDQTSGLADELASAREQLDALQEAVDEQDVATAQAGASALASQLDMLATRLGQVGSLIDRLAILPDVESMQETLESAADQLTSLSELDVQGQVEEVATILATADDALGQLQDTDPEVLVRPFDVEVVSETPIPVTLDRFYAPGLLALMLQHVAITFVALALVRERRQGTADVLRVGPATTTQRLGGTTIAHLLLGGVVAAALTGLIIVAFGVPAPASWLAFVGLVALTVLASIGYGLVVGAIARTDSQAVQLSMLALLTAIFFSGLFLPLDRINVPVRWLSWALPTTHAFQGLQDLMLVAQPVPWFSWVVLTIMAVASMALAAVLVPRREEHA